MNETQGQLKTVVTIILATIVVWASYVGQQECSKIQNETKQMRATVQTIRASLR